ncbi:MAG: hypothetical protein ABW360_06760 [Phenylobacterium sp.]
MISTELISVTRPYTSEIERNGEIAANPGVEFPRITAKPEMNIMIRIAPIAGVLLAGALVTGCATAAGSHQEAKTDAASSLAKGANVGARAAASDGLSSMAWGDKWTATNLFEEAAKKTGTIQNRFNLATGYQETGRLAEAAVLYRALLVDGQFTTFITPKDETDPKKRQRRFNVADESARRLADMGRSTAVPAAPAAVAGEAGQPAAVTVATGLDASPVSDASARRLDVADEIKSK